MSLEEILTDDDSRRLELTQGIREKFINEMSEKGMPDSKDDMNFLAKLLDGSDRAVLMKSKLKVEDQANNTSQETTKLIAELLSKHTVKPAGLRTTPVNLERSVAYENPVEGEMEQTVSTLTYDEFTSEESK